MTERPDKLNIHECVAEKCGSLLFFDWGLELLDKSGYNTPLGPGQQPYTHVYNVKVCARCRTAQAIIDGQLVDLSAMISSEEVETLIRIGKAVPIKAMDP